MAVVRVLRRASPFRTQVALGGIVFLAAFLRFGTLDVQSYWDDEGHTIELMRLGFAGMLREVPDSESAPHLYYVIAWLWAQVFGLGEIGLRSLSALAGTAAVFVVYLATRELSSARAGLIAAGVFAVNPLLVWYSQEARAYALLVLFSTGSLLFFARALNDAPRALWWWAVLSSAALATHYFAIFVVAVEAVILIRRRGVSSMLGSIGVIGTTSLLLLPLALVQRGKEFGFVQRSLASRGAQIPEQFLVGYGVWSESWGKAAAVLAAALVAVAVVPLLQARRSSGARGAMYALLVGVGGICIPLVLAVVGLDYVLTLYFVGALAALTAAVASGWNLTSIGLPAAAAYCALALGLVVVVNSSAQFQREDLRGAAQALGTTCDPRAIVVSPESVLAAYMPNLKALPPGGARVREIAILGMAIKTPGEPPRVPRDVPVNPPGFSQMARINDDRFTVIRFRAPTLRLVQARRLVRSRLGPWPYLRVDVFFEPACPVQARASTP